MKRIRTGEVTRRARRRSRWAAFIAVAGLCAAWASPAGAVNRFASPNGNGSGSPGLTCTESPPSIPASATCSLSQGLAALGPGDDLTLLGGTYPPIDATMNVDQNATVHGAPGAPATIPMIETVNTAAYVQGGAVLRDVRIVAGVTGDLDSGVQIFDNGMIDRVYVDAGFNANADACVAVNNGPVFRDSVCWTRGASGSGVSLGASFGSPNVATLRNVTAAATGGNGAGIRANATNNFSKLTVYATNTIALGDDSGTLADVYAQTDMSTGPTATVVLDHSNFSSTDKITGGSIVDAGANVATPPVFGAGVGNFAPDGSSAGTIDRGTAAAVNGVGLGSLALSGQPRCLGAAPDIGAEELAAPACALPSTGQNAGPDSSKPARKCKRKKRAKRGAAAAKKKCKRKKKRR